MLLFLKPAGDTAASGSFAPPSSSRRQKLVNESATAASGIASHTSVNPYLDHLPVVYLLTKHLNGSLNLWKVSSDGTQHPLGSAEKKSKA